jgi:hypothetical protein
MADSTRSSGIRCVIVTPETTVLDTTARGVILPLEDGQRGIGRGHAAFIGRLGAGEVRITLGEGREDSLAAPPSRRSGFRSPSFRPHSYLSYLRIHRARPS